jgi:hypothetical protein
MFTPRFYSMGDRVAINRDISNSEGTFAAGHEFVIIDIHFHRDATLYDLRDHEQRLIGDVPESDFTRARGE